PAAQRRLIQMARNSTGTLLNSARHQELEAIARETLKSLRSDPRPDLTNVVEFTVRLAASLLGRASEASAPGGTISTQDGSTSAQELTAEAEALLRDISTEELSGYLQSDPRWELASFLGQAGHWTQAETFLTRVTELAPTNRVAWQLRGMLLLKTGDVAGYDKI